MIYFYNYFFLSFKKLFKILGFKSINLFNIPSSRSLLDDAFKVNKPFYFIQVGANDGVSFDDLFDFIKQRPSRGIVIEPVKSYFNELSLNYSYNKDIISINKAIHPTKSQVSLFKIKEEVSNNYPGWVKGIASLDHNHAKKYNIKTSDLEEEIVEAVTFMNIVKKFYKYDCIDYLQIDTEGFDFEILKMIDFNAFKPKLIKYESVNLDTSSYLKSIKLLKEKGYFVYKEMNDNIAVNLGKIKLK